MRLQLSHFKHEWLDKLSHARKHIKWATPVFYPTELTLTQCKKTKEEIEKAVALLRQVYETVDLEQEKLNGQEASYNRKRSKSSGGCTF